MHGWRKGFGLIALAGILACTAEQTEEGELPEVQVTDSAALPQYDVDPANVNVGTDTQTVVTPDVDVVPQDTQR